MVRPSLAFGAICGAVPGDEHGDETKRGRFSFL